MLSPAAETIDPCWRTVGVHGDGSCSLLHEHVHCRNCPVFGQAADWALSRAAAAAAADEHDLLAVSQPVRPAVKTRSALVFRVAADWLALDVAWVQEIAPMVQPHVIPHRTRDGLAGLVNVRGQLMLAANLAQLIGEPAASPPPAAGARPRLVVVRWDHEVWAFTADDVPGVMALPEEAAATAPATLRAPLSELAAGLAEWNGQPLLRLRPDVLRATLRRTVPG